MPVVERAAAGVGEVDVWLARLHQPPARAKALAPSCSPGAAPALLRRHSWRPPDLTKRPAGITGRPTSSTRGRDRSPGEPVPTGLPPEPAHQPRIR
jgi:hypothetical protein